MDFLARAVLFLFGLGLVIYGVHRYETSHSNTQVIYVPSHFSSAALPETEQQQSEVAEEDADEEQEPEQPCDDCTPSSPSNSTEQPTGAAPSVSPSPSSVQTGGDSKPDGADSSNTPTSQNVPEPAPQSTYPPNVEVHI